jgi:uncharacterized protein DUF5818
LAIVQSNISVRGDKSMKRLVVLAMLVFALSMVAMAEEWTGYVADAKCASSKGAAAASDDHAGCAQACIKKGAAAVLITADGKVYKIENQDKVVEHVGHKVTLSGKMDADKITIDSVKM